MDGTERTKELVEKAMRIASREMDDLPELKVEVLNKLLRVRELLNGYKQAGNTRSS